MCFILRIIIVPFYYFGFRFRKIDLYLSLVSEDWNIFSFNGVSGGRGDSTHLQTVDHC